MIGSIPSRLSSTAGCAAGNDGIKYQTVAGLALLPIRVVQGFIFWGGGSRRFFYDPSKLDPNASSWMANKLQSAMPGGLFGTDHLIAFLLHHFDMLYTAIVLFSAAELAAGALLMIGLMTRAAALATVIFSIMLMAMFGWQGATCIDEWTMASCNLAMGATIALAGGGAFALDSHVLRRYPTMRAKTWVRWAAGEQPLPVTERAFQIIALVMFAAVFVFVVGTYSYYRGSVFTPYHEGPTNPSRHHFALSAGDVMADGSVRFHLYLDGGTPEAPSHVIRIELLDGSGKVTASWNAAALSLLHAAAIQNDFAYNQVKTGPFGLSVGMGAMATITLPPLAGTSSNDAALLRLSTVSGEAFSVDLHH